MMERFKLILTLLTAFLRQINASENDLEAARTFLEDYNVRAGQHYYNVASTAWAYKTNLTDYNQKIYTEATVKEALFSKEAGKNCSQFDWRNFEDDFVRRQFKVISRLGTAALPEAEIAEVDGLENEMSALYSTGQVCEGNKCQSLDPDLTRLFTNERNWNKLQRAWLGWRDATGRKMKETYKRFIELQNKAAVLDGFEDTGDYWRSFYDAPDFEQQVERLWQTVKPLYQQLHTFVRKRLQQVYKDNPFPEGGHIPAHLLGNMWGQVWNIIDMVKPYPDASAIDVTAALVSKGYNTTAIIKMAEDFFVSLGLEPMPQSFWENSMFEKPKDGRKAVCHASAWDFYNGRDFRIKQCTDITMDWLVTTHHEMGHVQFYLQYKHLPIRFRRGANPGFHEAVGDVLALSVATPEHLHEVGLLETLHTDMEADLNYLMSQALDKVSFLPFGFLIDQWRWGVFRGDTTPDEYNSDWWKLRCKYQGLSPPVPRSNDDFDPGAKYHVPSNVPYIRYFVSYILQFQFHKALCQIANNTKPLHRCDIYRSREAGTALGNMLKLGSSVPWPLALKQVTGTEHMDAQALMDYFKPLYEWLQRENEGETIGWEESCPPGSIISSATVKSFSSVAILLSFLCAITFIVS